MQNRERYKLNIAVFMILRKGEQILTLRRIGTNWLDGHYSIPAGALEQGETVEDAAIRECKEEVGVAVAKEDLRLANFQHCRYEDQSWLNAFFVSEKWQGAPTLCEPDRHSELNWVDLSDLPNPFVPYVRQGLEDYQAGKIYGEFGWE